MRFVTLRRVVQAELFVLQQVAVVAALLADIAFIHSFGKVYPNEMLRMLKNDAFIKKREDWLLLFCAPSIIEVDGEIYKVPVVDGTVSTLLDVANVTLDGEKIE